MSALAKRISGWRLASLFLTQSARLSWQDMTFTASITMGHRYFGTRRVYSYAPSVLLAATACGIVAVRRGSAWWFATVIPAALMAILCALGDV